jgi:hypothetical protein
MLLPGKPFDGFRHHACVEADGLDRAALVRHMAFGGRVLRLDAERNGVDERARVGAAADGERLGLPAGRVFVDREQGFDQLAVCVEKMSGGDFW